MSEFTLLAITNGDSLQLSEAFASIAAIEAAEPSTLREQLAEALLTRFVHANPWDTRLQSLLDKVMPIVQAQIANDDEFYCSADHPLRAFFDTIAAPASHWCPRDSRPNQQLYDKLSELVAFILYYWTNNNQTVPTANMQQHLDEFNEWLATEDKRAAMLEMRLCETELANLKLISAETRVIETINRNLAQRPLPADLHSDINGILKSELQYWAFNTDPAELAQLPLWKSWQRLLPALGQIFSGEGIEADSQLLYEQIPLVLAELERSLQYPNSNAQAYSQLVEHLNYHLMNAIQKQSLECTLFPAIASTDNNSQSDANMRVPRSLLQQTEMIQLGDWIIFDGTTTNDGADNIRCKLVLKNPELDQFLFVDHTGRKVMNKNTRDLALCLSTGIARPLPSQAITGVINQQLAALIERANRSVQAQLRQHKDKAEQVVRAIIAQQQAAAEAAERERVEEQERLQEQLEARRAAARKAIMEARALADEKIRREAEQAAELERLRIEQTANQVAELVAKQQQAAHSISELQVGAWIEISSETNPDEKLRAKLSVIISSTGKYIFADQFGRKTAEYTRTQLTALLVGEQIKILRNGDNFEDQLAKVIRGLRRDIS